MYNGYDHSNDCPITIIGFSDKDKAIGECKVPVFEEGEIIICDTDNGREICYPGRKPSKWGVDFEIFDNLDDAVKRAREIIDKIL